MSKEKCVVLVFIVAVVSQWSHGCYGANILASMTFAFKTSHIKTLSAIMSPLARRGHNITLLRSSNMGTTGFDQGAFSQTIIYRLNEYNPGFQEVCTLNSRSRLCPISFNSNASFNLRYYICHIIRVLSDPAYTDRSTVVNLIFGELSNGDDLFYRLFENKL